MSNANKFTPRYGTLTVIATAERRDFVTVAVQDSGIGMNKDQMAQAMKPFGQIQSAHTRGHEGTGLGLPISKALIEQHGGHFFLSSEPNVGTMVAFTLPVHAPEFSAASPASSWSRLGTAAPVGSPA